MGSENEYDDMSNLLVKTCEDQAESTSDTTLIKADLSNGLLKLRQTRFPLVKTLHQPSPSALHHPINPQPTSQGSIDITNPGGTTTESIDSVLEQIPSLDY